MLIFSFFLFLIFLLLFFFFFFQWGVFETRDIREKMKRVSFSVIIKSLVLWWR